MDWTRQMVILVSRWLKRQWILIGDKAYACMDLAIACIKRKVTLISRLRLDAQLYQFPIHEKKKLGRKPIKGARIHLKEFMNDINQKWQTDLVNWYGGEAIARTTPLLMGLFSFVTLVAFNMHQTTALVSMETASWYNKEGDLTFSDILAIVRRSIWAQKYFSKSENQLDSDKCPDKTITTLIYQLSLAA